MMHITFISDLHLRTKEGLDTDHTRTDEKLSTLEQAVQFAIDRHSDYLILGGDLLDTRDPPDWLRAHLVRALSKKFDGTVVILVGNHETNLINHAYESLQALELKRIVVISEPTELTVKGESVLLRFIPYLSTTGVEEAIAAPLPKNIDSAILFGHWDVNGSVSSGKSEYQISTIIDPTLLTSYDLVVLGHIHNHQHITTNNASIVYAGSPVYQNFGEIEDSAKGFLSISVDQDMISWDHIPTRCYSFLELSFDEENLKFTQDVTDKYVKAIFTGTSTFLRSKEVSELKSTLKSSPAIKVLFEHRIATTLEVNDSSDREDEDTGPSLVDSMGEFCNQQNKKRFLPVGVTIFEEAQNEISKD